MFFALVALAGCRARVPASHDDIGRPVALPRRITRVVSLAPNITEMLYAIGAGTRVVGTDDFSNFPPAARAVVKVGGMQPNIERIAMLKPDVVFASTEGNQPNLASALAAASIPLYVVKTDRVAEIGSAMRRLGRLLDVREAEARALQLERGIAAQRRVRAHRPRVLFAVWTDPLYVAGRDTFTDDLFALTGAENVVESRGWPQYSLETLAAAPPDVILYPRGAVTPSAMGALLARVPDVHSRVVAVDEDIFQRPGPRVAEAAKTLNAILDAAAR